jgi:hypothetical protein
MNLQCGHNADCDLDTICPKCGRSFLQKLYIPYLTFLGVLLVFYYLRPTSFINLLTPLFCIFSWFLIGSILRNRVNELSKSLMIIIPTMIVVAIAKNDLPQYLESIKNILFILSFVFLSIPILSSIRLGFQDAVHYNGINRGSYWIVFSIFVSIGITLLYFIFPYIIAIIQIEALTIVFQYIYDSLEYIYKYRSAFVAIVLGLVAAISISISFVRELKVTSYNIPNSINENQNNLSPLNIIIISIGNLAKIFAGAIRTAGDLARQILVIIFEEIFVLFKDTFLRTVLILLRMIRVLFIVVSSILLLVAIVRIVVFVDILWNSGDFWTTSLAGWLQFLLWCFIFSVIMWLILMLTYKKWREFNSQAISFRRAFFSFFGSKRDVLVAYRSITISIFMYMFFFALTFLGAWLIINPVQYLFGLEYPNPIGFLFTFSVGLIVIFGIIKLIFK